MPTKKKKVFIALKMAGIAGQDKLAGVFRYLNERYGERSPWDMRIVRTRAELTADVLRAAISDGTDGFIVSIPDTEDAVGPLAETSIPTIVIDIHAGALEERNENIAFIRNSAEDIGRKAAHFLLGQGVAHSYAFLHSDPMMDWSLARFAAFRNALNDAGLWCEEIFDPSAAAKLKRPAAVFCANDDRAFDLIKHLAAKRIKVPHDVAVLGVDNDALICENARPRISSVQPNFEEEGRLAAETLDAMMQERETPKRTLLVGVKKIVQRESTAEESHAGRLVQKAVAYINGHALEGIGVRDVVKHLKCSRRLADLRFRELQGRSILDAITERRLDEVKRLLAGTRDKMNTIASACGYKNPTYL
ncbi:MAG: substrate-binding domain-containing protein, partial [Kiritimatiellae bacterium]|nr:substrate-binding domain-containing protein [Kiritimatiellia bacterium]